MTSPPYWTLKDYREHPDQMGYIEDYEEFLSELDKVWRACYDALVPGGRLALQAITIRDQLFERAKREVDFIKRYIFPGSCIPSPTALLSAATAQSDFVLRGYERLLVAPRERGSVGRFAAGR